MNEEYFTILADSATAPDSRVEQAVQFAVSIAEDDTHGYSQGAENATANDPYTGSREGALPAEKRNSVWTPDFDCSSLVYWSLEEGGFKIIEQWQNNNSEFWSLYNGEQYTGDADTVWTDLQPLGGWQKFSWDEVKDTLQRGDLLFKKGHIAIYTGDGKTVEARGVNNPINQGHYETGDQGGEIDIYEPYDRTWLEVYRYTGVLEKINSCYPYSGGNASISNYATGEKINYATDFTGLGFNDNDFILNSSTGSLTIQNARDKIVDVAVNNTTVAYAYLANGDGEINGSGISQLEVIIGGNNSANTITAGSGGSSLWGGSGGNDILTGGNGSDIFFYGKNDGTDVINNASSSDVVNLYDVKLSDITSANVSGRTISATFNTRNTLQINSAENLSATFKLADGNFKYNHSLGTWQSA